MSPLGRISRQTAEVRRDQGLRTRVGSWPDMLEVLGEQSPLHRDPQLDPIIRRVDQILLRAKGYRSVVWTRSVTKQQLDLLQFPARRPAHLRA
jgi:hypothetical protein